MMEHIPFSPPDITEDDIQAVVDVLKSGWITTGPVARKFEKELVAFTGAGGLILQNSCTSALEQALRISGVGPGDDVLVPAYTYTATAAAALHLGANVVLIDNEPGGFVPAPEQFAAAVTSATKAIVTVDIGGIPYPVDSLANLVAGLGATDNSFGLDRPVLISDAAHSLGAVLRNASVGSIADFTALSFHAVKNLTTAEGGALAWRTGLSLSDEDLYSDLRRSSLHGQTKDAFAKDKPGSWEYDILETGYKTNMPDILAALGLSQLRRYAQSIERRRELVVRYAEELGGVVEVEPHEGADFLSSAHLALTKIPETDAGRRNEIIREMAEKGITVNVHYKPLPLFTAYRNLGYSPSDFPNAMEAFQRVVTLPLFGSMTNSQLSKVAAAFREAAKRDR